MITKKMQNIRFVFLLWVICLMFYLTGDKNLWKTNGEGTYSTVPSNISEISETGETMASYDGVAPSVCQAVNNSLNQTGDSGLSLTYKGAGRYEFVYSGAGYDTHKQMQKLGSLVFASEYGKRAKAAGLTYQETKYGGSGGALKGNGLGIVHWVLVCTLVAAILVFFLERQDMRSRANRNGDQGPLGRLR